MRPLFLSILLFIFPFIGCGGDNQGSNGVNLVERPPTPIKSLSEIANDMEEVEIDSWNSVESEQDSFGKIALDLERSLAKPMGGFASRAILLQKDLIILFKREMSVKEREIIINKTLEGAKQLKYEMNEVIRAIPENDIFKLKIINGLRQVVETIQGHTEMINKYKNNGFINNREEIIENNKYLAQYNKELAQRNKELRSKVNLARGTRLLRELLDEIVWPPPAYPG